MRKNTLYLFLLLGFIQTGFAQDQLLLTNGKIKQLKGTVVDYDYNDIFYQSDSDRKKMESDIVRREQEQTELESTEKWKQKQEAKAEKLLRKDEKQQTRLEALKKQFEVDVKRKLETLSPADFEKWKIRELDDIKSAELKRELDKKLEEETQSLKADKRERRIRAKFTKSHPRSKVFSILKLDGTEEVVYNADTMDLLANGEPEFEYGVEEMRLYIKGRQDGRKHSFHDVYIGAGAGLASALLLTYTWDAFYAPISPAICIAVMGGLRNVKPNAGKMEFPEHLQSEPYMDGYHTSAKGRKIFAFSMGAIGGLGVGITVGMLTNPLLQN